MATPRAISTISATGASRCGGRGRVSRAKHPGRSIVVTGVSLGSAAAVFASRELGRRVHGYILESPYQDLKTAVWNRTQTYLPPILAQLGYFGLRLVGPLFLPDLEEVSPFRRSAAFLSDVPVLILAGEADPLARPAEASALLDRVTSHGELAFFPGADHHNLFLSALDRYRHLVLDKRPTNPSRPLRHLRLSADTSECQILGCRDATPPRRRSL